MYSYNYNDGDRFFFAGPFLLGALTGGVAVAAFNPYRPRRYYPINNTPMPYYSVNYPINNGGFMPYPYY